MYICRPKPTRRAAHQKLRANDSNQLPNVRRSQGIYEFHVRETGEASLVPTPLQLIYQTRMQPAFEVSQLQL